MSRKTIDVLGTPLRVTSYAALHAELLDVRARREPRMLDFTNVHIVTARRHDPRFREITGYVDDFVPDSMPLVWVMNARGAGMRDRVYGPAFTSYCLQHSPPEVRHFFLGATEHCLAKLCENMRRANPQLTVAGTHHGYFSREEDARILEQIRAVETDYLWVGLGTPLQQEWLHRNRAEMGRMIALAVGFAFDVNAGTKPDAPLWMQRRGITWLYRIFSEPRRLIPRYVKWNSLFLFHLALESLRGGRLHIVQ